LIINRTHDIVFIQITLNAGRTLEQKKALYARIAELLSIDGTCLPAKPPPAELGHFPGP
jgi:hypothetical protein